LGQEPPPLLQRSSNPASSCLILYRTLLWGGVDEGAAASF